MSEVGEQLGRISLDPNGDGGDEAAMPTGDDLGLTDELQGDMDSEQGAFRSFSFSMCAYVARAAGQER